MVGPGRARLRGAPPREVPTARSRARGRARGRPRRRAAAAAASSTTWPIDLVDGDLVRARSGRRPGRPARAELGADRTSPGPASSAQPGAAGRRTPARSRRPARTARGEPGRARRRAAAKPTEVRAAGRASASRSTGIETAVHRQITSAPSTDPGATPRRAAAAGSRATSRTSANDRTSGSIADAPGPGRRSRRRRGPRHLHARSARAESAEPAAVRSAVMTSPSISASARPVVASSRQTIARCTSRPSAALPGNDADELHRDRAVRRASAHHQHGAAVAGHGLPRRRVATRPPKAPGNPAKPRRAARPDRAPPLRRSVSG